MATSQNQLKLESLHALLAKKVSQPENAQAGEYFNKLQTGFLEACGKSSSTWVRYYQIGPYRSQFRFSCEELSQQLTAPFSHLEIPCPPEDSPHFDLEMNFWDSTLSEIPLKPPRWSDAHASRLSLHEQQVFIQYDYGTNTLHALDLQKKQGIFWVKDARDVFFSERVCPIRSIFHWLSKDTSLQLIHGGSVGNEQGAVILVGRSGSGKSTASTSVLDSPLYFLGDDYCLVESQNYPKVHSLYASAKINSDMLNKFPHLTQYRVSASEGEPQKPSFLLYAGFKNRLKDSLPLKAILIPKVTGNAKTRIVPASSMNGLHALAPSTLFQSTGLGENSFKRMADLSRRLPCFFLESGTCLDTTPPAIAELLQSL